MKAFFSNRFIVVVSVFWFAGIYGQPTDSIPEKFTAVKSIACSSIKNQYKSTTCWSFAVISMLESELIQSGKGEIDLSEMFIVHQGYIEKAALYVRMHGNITFGSGGALNDPLDMIRKYGIVPTGIYSGLKNENNKINHLEMDAALKDNMLGLIKNVRISNSWKESYIGILDAYLGKIPDKFKFGNKEYTPLSFSEMLGIDPDNYLLFTSFTHHPYYQKFILEVPDNWSWGESYNLPLDEFQKVIDNSLEKGYSIAIACDMTEKGFLWKEGIALALKRPENGNDRINTAGIWAPAGEPLKRIFNEVEVTPKLRQEAFDNYETTDDHDMHIVGVAMDQNGKRFYIAKNSWGTENTKHDGFIYLSEAYLRYKTLNILINKKGVPPEILKKIGL
jgi:bleomycin hydrolase